MKATITLHKKPSIIERIVNRVFFGCKTEYIVPELAPKPDPYEGMTDEQIIIALKKENEWLKRSLKRSECENDTHTALWAANQLSYMMKG